MQAPETVDLLLHQRFLEPLPFGFLELATDIAHAGDGFTTLLAFGCLFPVEHVIPKRLTYISFADPQSAMSQQERGLSCKRTGVDFADTIQIRLGAEQHIHGARVSFPHGNMQRCAHCEVAVVI